jgi:hypothetical protein
MTSKAGSSNPKKFPKAAVQKLLETWWNSKTQSPLKKPKPPGEAHSKGGTVFDIQPELSSQQAVGVLLDLTEALGYEPKKKVIRRGGYTSKNVFMDHLCNALEKDFNAHYDTSEQSDATVTQEIHAYA